MKCYTKQMKQTVINEYLNGTSILKINKTYKIARSTIYIWLKDFEKRTKLTKDLTLRDIHDLKIKTDRQQKIIEILKLSGCSSNSSQLEKYDAITKLSNRYNVHTLCEALDVAKGSYYNHIFRNKKGDTVYARRYAELKPLILKIFNENNQLYGAGKIAAILCLEGYNVSEQTVGKIMHLNGWFSRRTCSKKLYLQEQTRKKNLLNQQFQTSKPNEVWVSDVTYFSFQYKTYYICVIMDLYSRKIISHKISNKNSTQLTKAALKFAYESRKPTKPLIFHSDRGTNYTSNRFMSFVKSLGLTQSFSRGGNPYDNSVIESFFANMKLEELYRVKYKSEKELKRSIDLYIKFYNEKRPHSMIRYQTPTNYDNAYFKRHK